MFPSVYKMKITTVICFYNIHDWKLLDYNCKIIEISWKRVTIKGIKIMEIPTNKLISLDINIFDFLTAQGVKLTIFKKETPIKPNHC